MDYQKNARVFKALCDENRWKILDLLKNGEETFPVPKIKMPQLKSSGPPDRRNEHEGKALIFRIYIFV